MYRNHSIAFPRANSDAPPALMVPFEPSQLQQYYSAAQLPLLPDQLAAMAVSAEVEAASSSSYSSPGSVAAEPTHLQLLQRSVSSHSLHKSGTHRVLSSVAELLEDSSPVRRVFSTGDLHERINMTAHHSYRSSESPLSSESNAIIEGMSKACRYSPEEKKERIERYKSKRNQRNFNKKIKYACRKTLADSRPRIRGRFARNEEIEKSSQMADQWSHINSGEDEFDEDDETVWANFLDAFSSTI